MPLNDNICSRILTPKQVGPICWFMATFVAMFYSQRSRKILLDASKDWDVKKKGFTIFTDKRVKLFKLLKHILDDKYLKVESRESKDYKKFSDNTFGDVLTLLNKVNNKLFPYIPSKVSGFNAEYYIGKLYKFLNVDYVMFDYNVLDDFLTFSYLNQEYDDNIIYKIVKKKIIISITPNRTFKYIEENIKPPPILMVIVSDNKEYTQFYKKVFPNNTIKEGTTKKELKSMREQIFFKGVEYNLDSVILSNWNINKYNGHSIAGITCKKGKYIYNGWTRTSMDPAMANKIITRKIPCELMKYDWDIKKYGNFCLNTAKCIPDVLIKKLGKRDICFNFSKGRRVLVYVRKDAKSNTSNENDSNDKKAHVKSPVKTPEKSPKKCPEGKILNPKTGRCIKNKNLLVVKPSVKSPKKCPEGKVLNPKTGRCIKNKNLLVVKPPVKSPKKCPEGKVLNPKTGRCILIKKKLLKEK
jgi:hypothetical protein